MADDLRAEYHSRCVIFGCFNGFRLYDNWILSQTPSELTQEELRDRLRKLYHFMVPNINLYEKSIKIPY